MSLTYHHGSIFTSSAQTLVNPVNCKGVMGAGLALAFKQQFPDVFNQYAWYYRNHGMKPGEPYLVPSVKHQWVLNFPTKDHWRNPSLLDYIDEGLAFFVKLYDFWGITSVAFPVLGCGLGGLRWEDVQPLMEQALAPLPIPCEIWLSRR